jgi:hypothetical protein
LPFQFLGDSLEFAAKNFQRRFRRMRPKAGGQRLHRQNIYMLCHDWETRGKQKRFPRVPAALTENFNSRPAP